jgi:hypothetical protein
MTPPPDETDHAVVMLRQRLNAAEERADALEVENTRLGTVLAEQEATITELRAVINDAATRLTPEERAAYGG